MAGIFFDTSFSFLWHQLLRRNPFIGITFGDVKRMEKLDMD